MAGITLAALALEAGCSTPLSQSGDLDFHAIPNVCKSVTFHFVDVDKRVPLADLTIIADGCVTFDYNEVKGFQYALWHYSYKIEATGPTVFYKLAPTPTEIYDRGQTAQLGWAKSADPDCDTVIGVTVQRLGPARTAVRVLVPRPPTSRPQQDEDYGTPYTFDLTDPTNQNVSKTVLTRW